MLPVHGCSCYTSMETMVMDAGEATIKQNSSKEKWMGGIMSQERKKEGEKCWHDRACWWEGEQEGSWEIPQSAPPLPPLCYWMPLLSS